MTKVTVHAVDMSGRLNAEGKHFMKVSGKGFYDDEFGQKDCILDLSELNIDQIGVIAGFLDAVFDDCDLDYISGVRIVKPEEIKEDEEEE